MLKVLEDSVFFINIQRCKIFKILNDGFDLDINLQENKR